jgi:KDO2-lipid IV(A) lauroyltransferase
VFVYRALHRILPNYLFDLLSLLLIRVLVLSVYARKRIVKNLDQALGQTYSRPAKRGLARGVQANLERVIRDSLFQWLAPEMVRSSVKIHGVENLQAALSRGKGVIALGAHLGNFIMVGARLGIEGFPFHTMIRFPEDSRTRSFLEKHAPSYYQRPLSSMPRREAVEKILDVLRKNEIVFILGDNFKRGRVPAQFFGKPIHSSRGPISLALRSGAPILPTYIIRNGQGEMELRVDPEIQIVRNGDLSGDIVTNTQRLIACLEELVRRYPDQWNWLTVRFE